MDARRRLGIARGLAFFFGGLTILNLLTELRLRNFDANLWWIDLRFFPPIAVRILLAVFGILLLAFAVRPVARSIRKRSTVCLLATVACITVANAIQYYVLLHRGEIASHLRFPLSLIFCASFIFILHVAHGADKIAAVATQRRLILATVASALIAFPLLQMFCFGSTDYRRPADAVVVFGAHVYADGTASSAAADRVRMACELYHQGIAPKLIMSGGPGDGFVHETESMRDVAINLGVPAQDILLDRGGLNTRGTVTATAPLFAAEHFHRVLAVSHFYHLPRVKLAYQQQGCEVYTVPVREPLRGTPRFMIRELAAFWTYYFRSIL